jgi:hypothetical protein
MPTAELPQFLVFIDAFRLLICSLCGHALIGNNPLTHILEHDPTLRGNTAVLNDIKVLIGQRLPIKEAYQAIQLASPISPLTGLDAAKLGIQCLFENCGDIFSAETYTIRHLRLSYRVLAKTGDPRTYIKSCLY